MVFAFITIKEKENSYEKIHPHFSFYYHRLFF